MRYNLYLKIINTKIIEDINKYYKITIDQIGKRDDKNKRKASEYDSSYILLRARLCKATKTNCVFKKFKLEVGRVVFFNNNKIVIQDTNVENNI